MEETQFCSQCGHKLNTEDKFCSQCGSIVHHNVLETEKPHQHSFASILVTTLLIAVILYCAFIIASNNDFQNLNEIMHSFTYDTTTDRENIPVNSQEEGKIIPEKVLNLGYEFYLGEIESSSSTNITADFKNQVTQIAHDTQFPKELLKNIPIIILDNLALTGRQYIYFQNKRLPIPNLTADFLNEGGIFASYDNGEVIYLNKKIFSNGSLSKTLAHEFGHAIGHRLTTEEWSRYYSLRSIPTNTPRTSSTWELSPMEDFAEVYMNVYTGNNVHTNYGFLSSTPYSMFVTECYDLYMTVYGEILQKYRDSNCPKTLRSIDRSICLMSSNLKITSEQMQEAEDEAESSTEVQNCRRKIISNPEKYKKYYEFGVPFVSIVGPQTKSFIAEVMDRINGSAESPTVSEEELNKKISESRAQLEQIEQAIKEYESQNQQ